MTVRAAIIGTSNENGAALREQPAPGNGRLVPMRAERIAQALTVEVQARFWSKVNCS